MNAKKELSDRFCAMIMDYIDYDLSSKITNALNIILSEYDVEKQETQIVIYEGGDVDYYVKKFLITKKVEGCTMRTLEHYGKEIPKILKKINKPISEISSDDILFYIAKREIDDKITKATQNNELRYLRTFFSWMLAEEYITKNPCLKIKSIKMPKITKKAFTDMELEQIRNSCVNVKETCIVETLISTGCRVSELCSLQIDQIQNGKASIIGKGEKERIVYFNAKALFSIDKWLAIRKDDNPYLFPKTQSVTFMKSKKKGVSNKDYYYIPEFVADGSVDKSSVEAIVRRIGKRAGVPECHPHRFRRTCATNALKRGMPLIEVSKMLGHNSVATTQIYLDISDKDLEISHNKYVT